MNFIYDVLDTLNAITVGGFRDLSNLMLKGSSASIGVQVLVIRVWVAAVKTATSCFLLVVVFIRRQELAALLSFFTTLLYFLVAELLIFSSRLYILAAAIDKFGRHGYILLIDFEIDEFGRRIFDNIAICTILNTAAASTRHVISLSIRCGRSLARLETISDKLNIWLRTKALLKLYMILGALALTPFPLPEKCRIHTVLLLWSKTEVHVWLQAERIGTG
ncbi:hypothetical protein E6O75_ATG10346 [Venturia nashicola]|uniref:Uncharacterized protein n=1 Tax=Venturia nashicola TaxID=86259 RepID=A0A4Z1NT34_9PEZI|nr:hypothetical protein E6O75_ATG10346 [Venturia nashicola]